MAVEPAPTKEFVIPTTGQPAIRTHAQHPVTRALRAELDRCRSLRHQPPILNRWANEPSLRGRTIDEILAECASRRPSQNRTVESLIRLHQANDSDATTVLMAAIHPIVVSTANRLQSEPHHRHDAAWAAATHALSTLDPSDLRRRADQRNLPMLAYLGHMIRNSNWTLNPQERQRERHATNAGFTGPTIVSIDTDHAIEIADPQQPDPADRAHTVIKLEQLRSAVEAGGISGDDWQFLIDHRFNRTEPASGKDRARAHRTKRKLATLVQRAGSPAFLSAC